MYIKRYSVTVWRDRQWHRRPENTSLDGNSNASEQQSPWTLWNIQKEYSSSSVVPISDLICVRPSRERVCILTIFFLTLPCSSPSSVAVSHAFSVRNIWKLSERRLRVEYVCLVSCECVCVCVCGLSVQLYINVSFGWEIHSTIALGFASSLSKERIRFSIHNPALTFTSASGIRGVVLCVYALPIVSAPSSG